MRRGLAPAKINLALLVGARRSDGYHEVATVLQRVALADTIELEAADELVVEGYADDTLVRSALTALAAAADVEPRWRVRIEKRIPAAGGLGGGSSDAATALRLANETLETPVPPGRLHDVASTIGADVPFFLGRGPQFAEGRGTDLRPVDLPQDYTVVLVLPDDVAKESTRSVYEAFDARGGSDGFDARRARLLDALAARSLHALPKNDLASSPLADDLVAAGALRADVSGAGPAVYGLFADPARADAAARAFAARGRTWITKPEWYL